MDGWAYIVHWTLCEQLFGIAILHIAHVQWIEILKYFWLKLDFLFNLSIPVPQTVLI